MDQLQKFGIQIGFLFSGYCDTKKVLGAADWFVDLTKL